MTTTLTKEQFITRSMAGERFEYDTCVYYYDKDKANPFRVDEDSLASYWHYMDGKTEFTIVEPEPILDRRWKWYRDKDEYTVESNYVSDDFAVKNDYLACGWYKSNDYIDMKVKQ